MLYAVYGYAAYTFPMSFDQRQ